MSEPDDSDQKALQVGKNALAPAGSPQLTPTESPSAKATPRSQKPPPKPAYNSYVPFNSSQMSLQASRGSSAPHYRTRMAHSQARMTNADKEAAPENLPWTELDVGGMALRTLSKEIFKYAFLTGLYLNHNMLAKIPSEISKLSNLAILDLSGNQLKSLPPEMGVIFSLRELLLYDNHLNTLPAEIANLYLLENFGIDGNPLVEPLFSINQKQGGLALLQFIRDNNPVPPPQVERMWIPVDQEGNAPDSFLVFNYNVLCDKYAIPSHAYAPSWALAWEYRKELILQEILLYNADIVCLQEVETSQYEEFFRDQLRMRADYEGIFWPKSRARTMSDWEKKSVDGCAIFFKPQRFQLEEHIGIEFSQLALKKPDLRKTEDVFNRVMNRDNIAILARLEQIDAKRQIILANVHIHWDPAYKDVKLIQSILLAEELEKMCNQHPKASLIVCGDFNSLANSGVYEFLGQGTLKPSHSDFCTYTYEPYSSEGASHSLNLKSAYSHVGELPFTNYTPLFKGTIDYIWYKTSSLSVSGLLGPIPEDYFAKIVGLPSAHYPSDHVSMLVEFKSKGQAYQRRPNIPPPNKNKYF